MTNVILDIGNVICEWNPEKLVAGVFSDPDEQREALRHIIEHQEWRALDQGIITLDEAIENAAGRCSLERAKVAQVYRNTPESLVTFPQSVAMIRDLHKRGIPLYVLSNMQEHSWEHLVETYDFWSLFEGIVVSYKIKLIKPNLGIYEHITETYALEPSNTVFVDDTLENIAAARAFGLEAVHMTSLEQGKKELYATLGL